MKVPIDVADTIRLPSGATGPALLPTAPPTTTPPTTAPPPPPPTAAPAAHCYPLSNEGTCYEPGEYCRETDHGASGVAGDGKAITCEDNDGWRWEPGLSQRRAGQPAGTARSRG